MSKKTRSHKRNKTHKSYKRNKTHKKNRTYRRHTRRHTRRHLYRKRREILTLPGSKGVPIFSIPEKKQAQKILVNHDSNNHSGNMIPGLRNM